MVLQEKADQMNRRLLILTGVAALLVFCALILFGPGAEKDKPDPILWKKEFQKIEYIPAGKARAISYRFVRNASLTRDTFTVEAPGKSPRRGSYNVKNIFTDFGKPRNAGVYKLTPEKTAELGFSDESPEVLLYEKETGAPVRLQVGKKNQNGNTFIRSTDPAFKDQVLLMASYLFERFDHPIKEFREQRYLVYTTDSITEEIDLTVNGKSFWMKQTKYKKDGVELPRWLDRQGTEIPLNQANGLENSIREIMIQEFRDSDGVPPADEAWKRAGTDSLVARVRITGQDEITIRLRSRYVVDKGGQPLTPAQCSTEPGTDFVKGNAEKEVSDRLDQLLDSMQKKAEAQKREEAEKAAKSSKPQLPAEPAK